MKCLRVRVRVRAKVMLPVPILMQGVPVLGTSFHFLSQGLLGVPGGSRGGWGEQE